MRHTAGAALTRFGPIRQTGEKERRPKLGQFQGTALSGLIQWLMKFQRLIYSRANDQRFIPCDGGGDRRGKERERERVLN